MQRYVGGDDISVTVVSDDPAPGAALPARSYTSLQALADEIGLSRWEFLQISSKLHRKQTQRRSATPVCSPSLTRSASPSEIAAHRAGTRCHSLWPEPLPSALCLPSCRGAAAQLHLHGPHQWHRCSQ